MPTTSEKPEGSPKKHSVRFGVEWTPGALTALIVTATAAVSGVGVFWDKIAQFVRSLPVAAFVAVFAYSTVVTPSALNRSPDDFVAFRIVMRGAEGLFA